MSDLGQWLRRLDEVGRDMEGTDKNWYAENRGARPVSNKGRALSPEVLQAAAALRGTGMTWPAIAEALGVNPNSLRKRMAKEHG